jgi:NADPH-dependent curcumin reductase CurA
MMGGGRLLQGIDIIYESVGGDMLKICLGALAKKGRLIVIGMMSQYSSGWKPSQVRIRPYG